MTPEEQQQSDDAKKWLKGNGLILIEKFAPPAVYKTRPKSVTLFMAGSPGAGKTEIARSLANDYPESIVRIDADEIRALCPGYGGANAHVFQAAATQGVHMLYDHVLEKSLHTIMDGTFAYAGAHTNIERSLSRGREVGIIYVYQEPRVAWDFTQAREAEEGRRVTRENFIKAFLLAREHANEAKEKYGDRIFMHLVVKNFETGEQKTLSEVTNIDPHIGKVYSREDLELLIPV